MEVTIIFKIAAVGILVSILSQILNHSGRDEQATAYEYCQSSELDCRYLGEVGWRSRLAACLRLWKR